MIASIFNNRMQLLILNFGWALIQNFKDIFKRINKIMLLISTMSMWLLFMGYHIIILPRLYPNGGKAFLAGNFCYAFAQIV